MTLKFSWFPNMAYLSWMLACEHDLGKRIIPLELLNWFNMQYLLLIELFKRLQDQISIIVWSHWCYFHINVQVKWVHIRREYHNVHLWRAYPAILPAVADLTAPPWLPAACTAGPDMPLSMPIAGSYEYRAQRRPLFVARHRARRMTGLSRTICGWWRRMWRMASAAQLPPTAPLVR